MTISLKTQKMLWGRAAGRCSCPDCKMDLFEDETEADDPTLVGENCHIVAESDGGPRSNPSLAIESRNSYGNLILLCRNHHKIVDAQEATYTVEVLRQWKLDHEAWVRSNLGFDEDRQREDEHWAGIVDKWERLAHVDNWSGWTSFLLSSGQPELASAIDNDLAELRVALLRQIWPKSYPVLQDAFLNFRIVLQDLQELFRSKAERPSPEFLVTRKFYQINEWDESLYAKLSLKYDFHVDLVQDLVLELTRAANLIADHIRSHLRRTYRLSDGRFAVTYGPTIGFSYRTIVVQYSEDERRHQYPYLGLEDFKNTRQARDENFGKGTEP